MCNSILLFIKAPVLGGLSKAILRGTRKDLVAFSWHLVAVQDASVILYLRGTRKDLVAFSWHLVAVQDASAILYYRGPETHINMRILQTRFSRIPLLRALMPQ